jgi:hypothetical protein
MNKSPLFLFIIAVVSGILAVFLVLRLFASADAGVRIDKKLFTLLYVLLTNNGPNRERERPRLERLDPD